MHQPLIPAGGADLRTAAVISNLQYMMDQPGHRRQPQRLGLPLVLQTHGRVHPAAARRGAAAPGDAGILRHPAARAAARWAATTSSTACAGSRPIRAYRQAVEWLGCPWGHAVAPSTPVQDFRLHVRAWQHHFAAIFGLEALSRVRGFSPAGDGAAQPSRRRLRVRPDPEGLRLRVGAGAGAHGRATRTGGGIRQPHLPHRLVAPTPAATRQHHRHRQDPGQRHQAGRPDAAVLRGQGPGARGPRRPQRPAAGHPDRRRRKRRRDDERVPAQVHGRGPRVLRAPAPRS